MNIGGIIKYTETNGIYITSTVLKTGKNLIVGYKQLYKWSKELTDRKVKSASSYFYQMKQDLQRTKEVMSISNNKKLKTKVKIRLIRELMPKETVQYVADVLKISRQAVHRHL